MSTFEVTAIKRLVDKANAAGVPIPAEVTATLDRLERGHFSTGGGLWVEAHPDEDSWPVEAYTCCSSSAMHGPDRCTCWRPVFEVEQATPRPPTCPDDLAAMKQMCGDCAFRKDSPERADAWAEETLMDLAVSGDPFWCHTGMRRPAKWVHPDLGEVEGDTADWQPPIIAGIPYQADGAPGLLCAGWSARAAREASRE